MRTINPIDHSLYTLIFKSKKTYTRGKRYQMAPSSSHSSIPFSADCGVKQAIQRYYSE